MSTALLFGTEAKSQVTSELRDFYDSSLVTNDTMYFWVGLGQAHAYNFNQYNISANQVTYKVRKANLQLMSGASSNFCIYHNNDAGDPQSQCYIPSIMLSGTFSTDPGEYNTLLADFSAGTTTTGISIVRYTFFDIGNANDSITITLIYNVTPVGVAESMGVNLGEPFPNPASTSVTVEYSFNKTNTGTAVVTDLNGRVIYYRAITSESDKLVIETSSWAKGVYLLSVADENGIAAKRKIVVE